MKSLSSEQEDQLKIEIERIHQRGGSNYGQLISQVDAKKKIVHLNAPQLAAAYSQSMFLFLRWARGTGKTAFRGYRWNKIVSQMPRSTGLLIGPTYKDILTRIVPSLIKGLEMFGLYENLHFFVGRRPPVSWRKYWGSAYERPDDYRRYITFFNGTGIHLISHDLPNDGKGLNADWADGDEAALLDPMKLQENTDATLRGTSRTFSNSIFYGSRFYTTSMPLTPEGQWFNGYKDKALREPKRYNFIDATSMANKHNLRPGYLEEAKESALYQWVYDAEYLNIEPSFTKDGFYTLLDKDIHCRNAFDYGHYQHTGQSSDCRGDSDLVKGQPLILGVDWGAAINCLTVNQHLQSLNEYRTLKSLYALGADKKIQDDLFDDFNNYYQYHQPTNNTIYLWYDNTGNNKTGNTRRTRAQQAQARLMTQGWKVILMTVGGSNPFHDRKHLLWTHILKEKDFNLPKYRMNYSNCKDLYLSMLMAKTKPGRNGETLKDKSSEKSSKIARQHATDLSDANDAPIYGMFKQYLKIGGRSILPDTQVNALV